MHRLEFRKLWEEEKTTVGRGRNREEIGFFASQGHCRNRDATRRIAGKLNRGYAALKKRCTEAMMTVVTITAEDIITGLWDIATRNPSKANRKRGNQKRAFKLILDIRGGVGFIACRPKTEIDELARRGVCSPDLPTILWEMAEIELQWRKGLLESGAREKQMRKLVRAVTQPGKYVTCLTIADTR
jgi:hypothetical protein